MKDLKIRVANEAESKEAQELFFELGYVWTDTKCQTKMKYTVPVIYSSFEDGDLCCDKYDINHNHKEITIQELRDMVNPMKEYLEKQADGSYKLVMRGIVGEDGDIEVPDGAEVAVYPHFSKGISFFKNNFRFAYADSSGEWKETDYCPENLKHWKSWSVAWKRHTQPEELPFLDSLNDQYAEIEQVRQQTDSLPEFKHDFVNHPKHYCDHPSGIECIEITRHHDFAIGNAIKYLWRAGLKDSDNEIQDLKKAVWYIQDKIAQLENK